MRGLLGFHLSFFDFFGNFHLCHLDLVFEIIAGTLEFTHALAQSASKLGDFLCPEEQEDDDEDDCDLRAAKAADERQSVGHGGKLVWIGGSCKEITPL